MLRAVSGNLNLSYILILASGLLLSSIYLDSIDKILETIHTSFFKVSGRLFFNRKISDVNC